MYKITKTKNGNTNDIANSLNLEQAKEKILFALGGLWIWHL